MSIIKVPKPKHRMCCKPRNVESSISMVAFSTKPKNKITEPLRSSTDSFDTSIFRESKSQISVTQMSQMSEEFEVRIKKEKINRLTKYQIEIDKRCSDECPTKRNLTLDIVAQYENVKTSKQIDLASIVYLKTVNPEAPCPYAIDEESYFVFQDFFNPLISDMQNGVVLVDSCQGLQFGMVDTYQNLDLNGEKEVLRVMYCEIIIRRNLNDYSLNGCLKNSQRIELKEVLQDKCRELFLAFSPIIMPEEWSMRLKMEETYLINSRGMLNFPKGRLNMIYKDEADANIGAIINYDDHLQLVFSTNSGKIGHIFNQSNKIINSTIMHKVDFLKHQKYGFITYSPQFIGTGFTIRLLIKLRFTCLLDDVEEIYLKDLGLTLTVVDNAPSKGLTILSNRKTIRITELEIFKNILEGFRRLNDLDFDLEKTTPFSIVDRTMPTESLSRLVAKIYTNTSFTYTKKYLTDIIVHQYEHISTGFNGLFNHCIRANAFFPKSLFPKASDPDCYSVFSRFFTPIILESSHARQCLHSPVPQYGSASDKPEYKFYHHLVKSYRVRFSRNLDNYPFSMLMSPKERNEVEDRLISAFQTFPPEIAGCYYQIKDLPFIKEYKFLLTLNLIPKPNNSVKRASWIYREWPHNRGLFIAAINPSHPQNILTILVNESDHFQVSCINYYGTRLDYCYERAVLAMQYLDRFFHNNYAKKMNYGFLSSNPQNIGCSMRISAKIHLQYLGKDRDVFNEFCILNRMVYRGIYGTGSKPVEDIYDLSININLNYTENQILTFFIQRLRDLILEERTYDHTIEIPILRSDLKDNYAPVFVKMLENKATSDEIRSALISLDDVSEDTVERSDRTDPISIKGLSVRIISTSSTSGTAS